MVLLEISRVPIRARLPVAISMVQRQRPRERRLFPTENLRPPFYTNFLWFFTETYPLSLYYRCTSSQDWSKSKAVSVKLIQCRSKGKKLWGVGGGGTGDRARYEVLGLALPPSANFEIYKFENAT